MNRIATPDLLVHGCIKGDERYIFVHGDTDEDRQAIFKVAVRWAMNRELSFDFQDCEQLAERILRGVA
jgi:hypothetical protein